MGRAERRHKEKPQNNYIHQEKRWKAHIHKMVQKIYAAACLVLRRKYDFTTEQIVDFMSSVQDLWLRDGENGFDILKTCFEETGVNFIRSNK